MLNLIGLPMTPPQLAINAAARARNEAVAEASKSAPDYAAFDAATQAAEAVYRAACARAYRGS